MLITLKVGGEEEERRTWEKSSESRARLLSFIFLTGNLVRISFELDKIRWKSCRSWFGYKFTQHFHRATCFQFPSPWSAKCRVADYLGSNKLTALSWSWGQLFHRVKSLVNSTKTIFPHLDPRSLPETGSWLVVESLRTQTVARDLNTGRECRRRSWAAPRVRAESVAAGKSLVTSSRALEPLVRSC